MGRLEQSQRQNYCYTATPIPHPLGLLCVGRAQIGVVGSKLHRWTEAPIEPVVQYASSGFIHFFILFLFCIFFPGSGLLYTTLAYSSQIRDKLTLLESEHPAQYVAMHWVSCTGNENNALL